MKDSIPNLLRKASFILLFVSLCPFTHASFKEWLNKKLPYKLPAQKLNFNELKPSSSVEVLDHDAQVLFYLISQDRLQIYRNLNDISPVLQSFVVLSEDAKFFAHDGFDVKEIQNSLKSNLSSNKIKRGGSTLSQQLAKNLFLDRKRSYTRKLFEVPWTLQLERDLSKKQLLELYLNLIEWGPGIYGAEAASRHYFDKTASEILPEEALYLAMIVPGPIRFDLYANPSMRSFIEKKKRTFALRILREKKISQSEYEDLIREETILAPLDNFQRRFPLQHSGQYFGNRKQMEGQWSPLISYIRKNNLQKSPLLTQLAKKTTETIWPPLVKNPEMLSPDAKKTHFLVYRNEDAFILDFKEIPADLMIQEEAEVEVPAGLRIESDFSLKEVFYARPIEATTSSSHTVDTSRTDVATD